MMLGMRLKVLIFLNRGLFSLSKREVLYLGGYVEGMQTRRLPRLLQLAAGSGSKAAAIAIGA